MIKKADKYFSQHVRFNSAVHIIGGVGIGILIASPIIGIHPVRWGVALILVALLGHVFASSNK